MSTTAELIEACRRDLTLIDDLVRWAHADGFVPSNAAPLPRNVDAAPPDEGADQVSGELHDIGIGSHRSRAAYEVAMGRLADVERLVATAYVVAVRRAPRLVKPAAACPLVVATTCVGHTRQRLNAIERSGSRVPVIHTALVRARTLTHRTLADLDAAFQVGPADPDEHAQIPKADRCWVCDLKGKEEKTGGRCYVCAWYKRKYGHERPRSLDSVGDATEAQKRRLARGEGHGDEAFSNTSARPITFDVKPRTGPTPKPGKVKKSKIRNRRKGPTLKGVLDRTTPV